MAGMSAAFKFRIVGTGGFIIAARAHPPHFGRWPPEGAACARAIPVPGLSTPPGWPTPLARSCLRALKRARRGNGLRAAFK